MINWKHIFWIKIKYKIRKLENHASNCEKKEEAKSRKNIKILTWLEDEQNERKSPDESQSKIDYIWVIAITTKN